MDEDVANVLADFESECAAAGVTPVQALVAGGLHRGQWLRWHKGPHLPTMRSLRMARAGLASLQAQKAQVAA